MLQIVKRYHKKKNLNEVQHDLKGVLTKIESHLEQKSSRKEDAINQDQYSIYLIKWKQFLNWL